MGSFCKLICTDNLRELALSVCRERTEAVEQIWVVFADRAHEMKARRDVHDA